MGINPGGLDKRRETLIKKYGSYEAYLAANRENAAKGGRKGGHMSGGNFKNNRDRAREAGRKGGRLSRPHSINAAQDRPDSVQQESYKNEHNK